MPLPDLPSSRAFVTQLLNSFASHPLASADDTSTAASNPLERAPGPVKKHLLALHVLFPNELLPALDLLDRRLVTRFRLRREPGRAKDASRNVNVATSNSTAAVLRDNEQTEDEVAAQPNARDKHAANVEKAAAINRPLTASAVGQIHSSDAEMPDAPQTALTEEQSGKDEDHSVNHPQADTIYYVRSAQQRSGRYTTSYESITSYEVRLKAWNCSCPAFAFSAFPSVHPDPSVPMHSPIEAIDWTNDPGPSPQEQLREWSFGGASLGERTPPVCKHLLACVLAERCPALFGGFLEERDISVAEAAGWAAGWGG